MIDIPKEADRRARRDAEGLKFTTLDEMRRFIVERRSFWAKRLYANQHDRDESL